MVAAEDLFSYLYDLLLLQGLRHLDQFRGIALEDGLVHVARIREMHDDIPAHLLCKDLERTGLIHLLGQQLGILLVGHTQQKSVVIAFQSPHLQITCRGHERSVVVIDGIA